MSTSTCATSRGATIAPSLGACRTHESAALAAGLDFGEDDLGKVDFEEDDFIAMDACISPAASAFGSSVSVASPRCELSPQVRRTTDVFFAGEGGEKASPSAVLQRELLARFLQGVCDAAGEFSSELSMNCLEKVQSLQHEYSLKETGYKQVIGELQQELLLARTGGVSLFRSPPLASASPTRGQDAHDKLAEYEDVIRKVYAVVSLFEEKIQVLCSTTENLMVCVARFHDERDKALRALDAHRVIRDELLRAADLACECGLPTKVRSVHARMKRAHDDVLSVCISSAPLPETELRNAEALSASVAEPVSKQELNEMRERYEALRAEKESVAAELERSLQRIEALDRRLQDAERGCAQAKEELASRELVFSQMQSAMTMMQSLVGASARDDAAHLTKRAKSD